MISNQARKPAFSVLAAVFSAPLALLASSHVSAVKPPAPTNVVAALAPNTATQAPGTGNIRVTFSPVVVPGTDGVRIVEYRAFCTAPGAARTPSVPGDPSGIVVPSLPAATYTCFAIAISSAVEQSLTSGPSNVVTIAAAPAPAPATSTCVPGAPTKVAAMPAGPGQLSVNFVPGNNCGQINVQYRAVCGSSGGAVGAQAGLGNNSPVVVGSLKPKTEHVCQVTATAGGRTSPPSAWSNPTTTR
jgi:hypothetical protein